jgi:hypothetical protein
MSEKYLSSEILLQYYNKLNNITNNHLNLDEKLKNEKFIPTYKNLTLYSKEVVKSPKTKKGGNTTNTMVYFL